MLTIRNSKAVVLIKGITPPDAFIESLLENLEHGLC